MNIKDRVAAWAIDMSWAVIILIVGIGIIETFNSPRVLDITTEKGVTAPCTLTH